VTGLLAPPGDAGGLAAALERVLAEPALRARLGQAALAASRAYDVRVCVQRMEGLYDELLRGRRS